MGAEAEEGPASLRTTSLDGPLYRIARLPRPWAWPDWANVGTDGTFGNRWDDPDGVYRVLYASSSRLGALVEVLARFRPDPHVRATLETLRGGVAAGKDAAARPPGELDAGWLERRGLGVAEVRGDFLDVGHSATLAHLREALASRLLHHRLHDLDAAAVRLSVPRRFTQEISRYVYDRSTPDGRRRFAGIAYRSRLGDEFRNWAIFESAGDAVPWAGEPRVFPLRADDPDLREALARLGVRLVGP